MKRHRCPFAPDCRCNNRLCATRLEMDAWNLLMVLGLETDEQETA